MEIHVKDMIERNIRLIDIIRYGQGMDKSTIAQKMNVTWPTISGYVDSLLNHGVLKKEEAKIYVNDEYGYFIGISIGSEQIKLCILDMCLNLIDEDFFVTLVNDNELFIEQKEYMQKHNRAIQQYLYCATPDEEMNLVRCINDIFTSIEKMIKKSEINILGIGMAFTGAIDITQRKIIKAYNLPCLDGTDLDEGILLRNHLDFFESKGINISIENNSIAAGIAEKHLLYSSTINNQFNINYKYRDCKNIITILLGAGLGVSIIQDNKIYRGSNNLGGGAGHLEVPVFCNERLLNSSTDSSCTCGAMNCLDYRIRTDVFETTIQDFKTWNSQKIRDFFSKHADKKVVMGMYIGHLINLLNNLLNPDLIIISGKMYLAIDDLWEDIRRKRNENNLKYAKSNCALVKSLVGPMSPAIGAAISAYYHRYKSEIEWM